MRGFRLPLRLGALCYGIVLAARDRGIGAAVNGQGIAGSDIVRRWRRSPTTRPL